jgi:hypothetical protein
MLILVSDTSVLIDLERGSLLKTAFDLPYEFAVPDILYEQEIKDYNGEELISLGLRVEELGESTVSAAIGFRRRKPAISVPDSFALALAQAESWTLLTGDGPLRKLAKDESVKCHGTLWIFDQMYTRGVAEPRVLYDGLNAIASHSRCRLPRVEINIRLRQYS